MLRNIQKTQEDTSMGTGQARYPSHARSFAREWVVGNPLLQPLDEIQIGQCPVVSIYIRLTVRRNQHASDGIDPRRVCRFHRLPEGSLAVRQIHTIHLRRNLSASRGKDGSPIPGPGHDDLANLESWNRLRLSARDGVEIAVSIRRASRNQRSIW